MLVGYSGIRIYLSTMRLRILNEETLRSHLDNGGKAVAALWHQRLFCVIGYARRFRQYAPSAIVSKSRDGELMAQLVVRLGIRPIRGSSSHGGKEAFAAVVEDLRSHTFVIHAVDGPHGPKGVVKAGLVRIAEASGSAIFPVYISTNHAWTFKSWDRFILPKPFSRIVIQWGDPVFTPGDMDERAFERVRADIEQGLSRGYARGDAELGWAVPL